MIGQFVFSKAGHDKGSLYVVTAQEGAYAYVCDGRLKTLAAPKKKLLKHLQPVSRKVEEGLLERLASDGQVRDEEIKYAIKQYRESRTQTNSQREALYV